MNSRREGETKEGWMRRGRRLELICKWKGGQIEFYLESNRQFSSREPTGFMGVAFTSNDPETRQLTTFEPHPPSSWRGSFHMRREAFNLPAHEILGSIELPPLRVERSSFISFLPSFRMFEETKTCVNFDSVSRIAKIKSYHDSRWFLASETTRYANNICSRIHNPWYSRCRFYYWDKLSV